MDEKVVEIYRLKQERAAHSYKIACDQEDRIRGLLDAISARENPQDGEIVSDMKITGYDAQWQVWSDKRRIILNQRLALCLANKDQKRKLLATRLAELNAQSDLLKNSQLQRRQRRSSRGLVDQRDTMLLHSLKK